MEKGGSVVSLQNASKIALEAEELEEQKEWLKAGQVKISLSPACVGSSFLTVLFPLLGPQRSSEDLQAIGCKLLPCCFVCFF